MKAKNRTTMPTTQPLSHAAAKERLRALVPAAIEELRKLAKSDDRRIADDAKRGMKEYGISPDA